MQSNFTVRGGIVSRRVNNINSGKRQEPRVTGAKKHRFKLVPELLLFSRGHRFKIVTYFSGFTLRHIAHLSHKTADCLANVQCSPIIFNNESFVCKFVIFDQYGCYLKPNYHLRKFFLNKQLKNITLIIK